MEEYYIEKEDMSSIDKEMKEELDGWIDEAAAMGETEELQGANITLQEVLATFGTCSSTPGPDGINGSMIDNADRQQMAKCLHILWNKVWNSGDLPSGWKLEHRELLPKPGKEDYNHCNSYRTISMTDLFGKRMEKVAVNRLKCNLESSGFDPMQFAYLENRSATQALLVFNETVARCLSEKKIVGALFYDFTDAFGTVDRDKLLYKMKSKFGISGRLLIYLKGFLEGRRARIRVNDRVGEWKESNYGTSAGTVLGAILFIVYLSDVPEDIKPKFADDLVGLEWGDNVIDVQDKLQKSIDQLNQWSRKWNMELNIGKTRVMLFGSKSGDGIKVTTDGVEVEQVEEMKYLGITLDGKLSFKTQAEKAVAKARRAFFKVSQLIDGRRGISIQTGINLYKGLVLPHLEYGIPAWARLQETSLKELDKVQSQCLRTIVGATSHSSSDALDTICNMTPIRIRIEEMCKREYVKILSKPAGHVLREMMEETENQKFISPLSYLKHMSKDLSREISGFEVEEERLPTPEDIINTGVIEEMVVVEDIGNSKNRTEEQKEEGKHKIKKFIIDNSAEKIIVFTDGSVSEGAVGRASCAAVMMAPQGEIVTKSELVGDYANNVEAELNGIALAVEMGINHWEEVGQKNDIYIMTDCKSAIDLAIRFNQARGHNEALDRIKVAVKIVEMSKMKVKVAWVPGHAGVDQNEMADELAKAATKEMKSAPKSKLSLSTCRKIGRGLAVKKWQQRWRRGTAGRDTFYLIPRVGRAKMLPQQRKTGVTYCRLLLNSTLLLEHQKRWKTSETSTCDCNSAIESVGHFLLECPIYNQQRRALVDGIGAIWEENRSWGSLNVSVELLPAPELDERLTVKAAENINKQCGLLVP